VSSGSAVFGLYPRYNDGLVQIFGRPWFRRVWTFQEVVLARRAEIICGPDRITWDQFSMAAHILQRKDASTGFSAYNGGLFSGMQQIRALRERLGLEPPARPLSYAMPVGHPLRPSNGFALSDKRTSQFGIGVALFLTATNLSKEVKDKVYGIYAIYQKVGIKLPPPNYKKSLQELVIETSTALVMHEQSFELLYYVGATRVMPDLPSWVPDPSHGQFSWIPCHEYFHAAGSTKPRFTIGPSHKLSLYGVLIDSVCAKTSFWSFDELKANVCAYRDHKSFIQIFGPMLSSIKDMLHHVESISSKSGSLAPIDRVCEILLQEIPLSYQDSPSSIQRLRQIFAAWAKKIQHPQTLPTDVEAQQALGSKYRFMTVKEFMETLTIRSMEGYQLLLRSLPSLRHLSVTTSQDEAEKIKHSDEWKTLLTIDQDEESAMIHEIVVKRWMNNCLFTTSSARIGLASSSIEEGDQIALFAGFLLPMVIRAQGTEYRLICPAYVEGIMLGEKWPTNENVIREFTIC
jgi:hypothetical protein